MPAEPPKARLPGRVLARPPATSGFSLRLFCLPYAGGGSAIYRGWQNAVPAGVEVCPVQLAGRERRLSEPCFREMGPLVSDLVAGLYPYLDLDFAVFGHSMGALAGFELCRALRKQRAPGPAHLFVSGYRAPQFHDPEIPYFDLPDSEFLSKLRFLNGTPRPVLEDAELLALLLPLLRADFQVAQTYRYVEQPPLAVPITAFGGSEDMEVSRDSLEAWRHQTTEDFQLEMLPGDHFFLNASQATLLRRLSQSLEEVLGRTKATYG